MAISAYPIAAAAGCFKRESGVNPGIWESCIVPPDTFYHVYQYDNIGGYGFGQFTNVRNPNTGEVSWRCRDYYLWCVANGHNPEDGNAELYYIINVENVWMTSNPSRLGFQTQADFWNTTSTALDDLVYDWLSQWEGVPGDALLERQEAARRFYTYIYQHKDDDPADYQWITGNFYTTDAQMLNNVMCMYFYLNGFTPDPGPGPGPGPGPTPGRRTRKFMMLYQRNNKIRKVERK